MGRFSFPLLALAVILVQLASCLSEEVASNNAPPTPARLLIEKRVLNRYLVEGRDIVVNYNLFNIGENTASDVSVNDVSFPAEHFELISGLLKFVVPRVQPASNLTHTAVLRPKTGVWGRYNFTSAEVTYRSVEGSNALQFAFTSEPGEGFIVPARQFDKQFSPHYLDWTAFAVMCLPSLLLPFLLWNKSKSHYESLVVSKKKQ